MRRWLLPESIEDLLPRQAAQVERLRARLLETFRVRGYELVVPPLVEYLDSLLTGTGRDLDLRTFKLVDQLSGRTLGLRADITPQVARIDAHLLNRRGVTRLCYCGSVVHTLPSSLTATREPLQIGAEIYGHAGIEADVEVIRLLAESLDAAGIGPVRIDLSHVGVFRALMGAAGIEAEMEEEIFAALQAKDQPQLLFLTQQLPEPGRSALRGLSDCYGESAVLDRAERLLPGNLEIESALADLRNIGKRLSGLPVSFDLADLRGYHYHSGVVFAAYCDRHPGAIALGGRYDKVGKAFGRGRPATGFSMDLRDLAGVAESSRGEEAVLAPLAEDAALEAAIHELRDAGEIVIIALPGHDGNWHEAGCNRQLVLREGRWQVVPLLGEQ